MKKLSEIRMKNRYLIYFIISGYLFGSLCAVPFHYIVSAQPPPDNGFQYGVYTLPSIATWAKGYTYKGTASTLTFQYNFVITQGDGYYNNVNPVAGWKWNSDDNKKYCYRAEFWFSLATLYSYSTVSTASLTIAGTESKTAGDDETYYLCAIPEFDNPPLGTDNHLRYSVISSAFDCTAGGTTISIDPQYIHLGDCTGFQIRCYSDCNLVNPNAVSGDYVYGTFTTLTLTLGLVISPPVLISNSPADGTVVTEAPTLMATCAAQGGGYDYRGVCYLQSNESGSWVTHRTLTVQEFQSGSMTFPFPVGNFSGNGKYWWRIQTKYVSSNVYHNYTRHFVYNTGSPPPSDELRIYISNPADMYSVGDHLTVYTYIPGSFWDPFNPGKWKRWCTDENGTVVMLFNNRFQITPALGPFPDTVILHWEDHYVAGNWTLWLGDIDEQTMEYTQAVSFSFNVSGPDDGYRVVPWKYTYYVGEEIKYNVWGSAATWLWVSLVNVTDDYNMTANHHYIIFGGSWEDRGGFSDIPVGTYRLEIWNDSKTELLNWSRVITVLNASAQNQYVIGIGQTTYYLGDNLRFLVQRVNGGEDYVINVWNPDEELVYQYTCSVSSKLVDLYLGSLGQYSVLVYDVGKSPGWGNSAEKYFVVTNDPYAPVDTDIGLPDTPEVWSAYIPWVAFGVLTAVGTVAAVKMQNGFALPVVLFGGMMMMGIPGTFLNIIPLWLAFLCGLALILLIVAMLRR